MYLVLFYCLELTVITWVYVILSNRIFDLFFFKT